MNTFSASNKRIGLYGIYGLYNFGCEAIVRGTVDFLHRVFPDCEITYFSYNYEYDVNSLTNTGIKVQRVVEKNSIFRRCLNKAYSLVFEDKGLLMFDYKKIIKQCDIIYSIGGDLYTIPEVERNKGKYKFYNPLVAFCEKAFLNQVPVYVYGASIGPFGEYKRAIEYYRNDLVKYEKIYCREYKSMEYLKSIGVKNLDFMPDPGLTIHAEISEKNKAHYIGINLSPLSQKEIHGNDYKSSEIHYSKLVETIFQRFGQDILLIPHVVSPYGYDDDLSFLKSIYDSCDENVKKHIQIAEPTNGFLGIKRQIHQCDIVISARMHCAINALTESIPTILLSYSQKSVGVCEYVYGNQDYLVELSNIDSDLISKIEYMLSNVEIIHNYLSRRNIEIQEEYISKCKEIRGIYGS